MKDTCQDIAPLLAAMADAPEGTAPDLRATAHLAECDGCQRALWVQQDVHGLLRARAGALQGQAPAALRTAISAQVPPARAAGRRWIPVGMPVAATLLLALLGVFTYGATSASSSVLAAQLALDHLKCSRLVSPGASVNPVQVVKDWAQRYDWTPRVPTPSPARKAALIEARRCLYGHGHLAHLLYEIDGRTVSVFVMPRQEYPAAAAPARHDFLGQHAEVWAEGDQSFAVVGDLAPETMAAVAAELRAAD